MSLKLIKKIYIYSPIEYLHFCPNKKKQFREHSKMQLKKTHFKILNRNREVMFLMTKCQLETINDFQRSYSQHGKHQKCTVLRDCLSELNKLKHWSRPPFQAWKSPNQMTDIHCMSKQCVDLFYGTLELIPFYLPATQHVLPCHLKMV